MSIITAAGGVVWRMRNSRYEVLLILRNGTWDLPKGKLEPGETLPECAVREVAEETGSKMYPEIEASLGLTVHYYPESGEKVRKETHWWCMIFPDDVSEFKPQEEEGVECVEWAGLDEAIEKVGYENLREVLENFRKMKSGN